MQRIIQAILILGVFFCASIALGVSVEFTYDQDGRLTQAGYSEPEKSSAIEYQYDQDSNLEVRVPRGFETEVTLSIEKEGSGNGTVTGGGGKIDCGANCTATFDINQEVVLTATPDEGSEFAGWGGGCEECGADANCTLVMDGNKTCKAGFEAAATPSWQDITEMVTTNRSRTLYDRIHRAFFVLIDVGNPSDEALSGPIRMVLTDLTIPVKTIDGVGLTPDGVTDDGDPYFIIVPEGESLAAGEMLKDLRVNFELQRKRLNFGIRIEQLVLPPSPVPM